MAIKTPQRKQVAIVLIAGLTGFLIAGAAVATATGALSSQPVTIHPLNNADQSSSPSWSTNSNGQTYGSLLNSISSATEPQLAQVIATNGKAGYVYSKQLNGYAPSSPTQALAAQAANTTPQFIPVYAHDGTTVIGQFAVSDPTAPTRTVASPGSAG
jgi:hypothetical protein